MWLYDKNRLGTYTYKILQDLTTAFASGLRTDLEALSRLTDLPPDWKEKGEFIELIIFLNIRGNAQ